MRLLIRWYVKEGIKRKTNITISIKKKIAMYGNEVVLEVEISTIVNVRKEKLINMTILRYFLAFLYTASSFIIVFIYKSNS